MKYKFDYTINPNVDNKKFLEICAEIEKEFTITKKEKMLEDVDGTQIQIFYIGNKKVRVINDYEVGALYVQSNVDLSDLEGVGIAK